MTIGSSAVSPWASISMVSFSAVSDGLADGAAAGGSFVLTGVVVLAGWVSSSLAACAGTAARLAPRPMNHSCTAGG